MQEPIWLFSFELQVPVVLWKLRGKRNGHLTNVPFHVPYIFWRNLISVMNLLRWHALQSQDLMACCGQIFVSGVWCHSANSRLVTFGLKAARPPYRSFNENTSHWGVHVHGMTKGLRRLVQRHWQSFWHRSVWGQMSPSSKMSMKKRPAVTRHLASNAPFPSCHHSYWPFQPLYSG